MFGEGGGGDGDGNPEVDSLGEWGCQAGLQAGPRRPTHIHL